MTGIVDDVYVYPVKGARGQRPEYLTIDPEVGVRNDRHYAIRRALGNLAEWAPKSDFYVGMNTPQMVAETPVFEGGSTCGGGVNRLDRHYLQELAERIGADGELQVQNTADTYALCDTKGAYVSFLNLASVRALSEFIGQEVDLRRFRMNVWLTGLEPFEELTWADKFPGTREILVGSCRFRVDDACERCLAIEANPATGLRDLELLKPLGKMMAQRGYKSPHHGKPVVMGILAAPLNSGIILHGKEVRLA